MTDQQSRTASLEMTRVPVTPSGRPVTAPGRQAAPVQLNHLQVGRAVA